MDRDPVCGMQVDCDTTQYQSDYQGKTYCFCSNDCKESFDKNPERYTQARTGQSQGSSQSGMY